MTLSYASEPQPVVHAVRFTTVHTLEEAEALAPAWWALHGRAEGASVFQSPAWLLPCWAHARDVTPALVLGWDRAGRLVALAAVAHEPDRVTLLGGERTDYLGVLVDPTIPDLADALLAALASLRPEAALVLDKLEARSPLLAARLAGRRLVRSEKDVCPALALSGRLDDVLPAGFYARTRQLRRHAERKGALEAVLLDGDAVAAGMARLYALHAQRWNPRGEPGSFDDEAAQAFYDEVARRAVGHGLLRLLELRLDGRAIAVVLAFASGGRVLFYSHGFDPAHARLSPGRLALLALIEHAVATGAYELDFLRGVERYKYDWGAQNRWTYRLELAREGHGGKALFPAPAAHDHDRPRSLR